MELLKNAIIKPKRRKKIIKKNKNDETTRSMTMQVE